MKKIFMLMLALSFIFSLSLAQKGAKKDKTAPETKIELKSTMDSVSYSYGMDIGKYMLSLEESGIKISIQVLTQGIMDYAKKSKTLLTTEEVTKILTKFSQEMQAKQKEQSENRKKEMSDKNIKEGAKFLEENKTKEGVKVTASGLQYKVLTEGKGKKPTLQDTITVHYSGRTLDGKEFDSSYKRGQPATFPLGGVIEGWKESLQLMTEGSKYQVYIPANLAYGEAGAGKDIGPNAVLIFDVELIKVGN